MKLLAKIILITAIVTACNSLWAVHNLQVGFHVAVNPNLNDLARSLKVDSGDAASNAGEIDTSRSRRDSILFYDQLISEAISSRGASGSGVGYPLGIGGGLDFRYTLNMFYFRLAATYSQLMFGNSGSLKTTSFDNSIEYNSLAAFFPVSFGLAHSLEDFFTFYFALGPYMSYALVEVKHSDPNAFTETALTKDATATAASTNLVPYKEQLIKGWIFGIHFMLGVQVPIVVKKVYISFEYIHYEGRSPALKVEATDASGTVIDDTVGDTISHNSDQYVLGVQYYLNI